MKKLIKFSKTKEREEKAQANEVKVKQEAKKQESIKSTIPSPPNRELFWDGYSDIGYC